MDSRLPRRLQWLNFFAADVSDGIGPFWAVYLLTQKNVPDVEIGILLTALNAATLLMQTPSGALIDATKYKRGVLAITALIYGAASMSVPFSPSIYVGCVLAALVGACAAVATPATAAITLGVVGPERFTRQTGANQAYNHAGNVVTALLAGVLGYWVAATAIFWLAGVFAVVTAICTFWIPAEAIDHAVARGASAHEMPMNNRARWKQLFFNRPLMLFALCVLLFHFANGAMLPLVGQKLSESNRAAGSAFISACVLVAQLVMVPMALLVGLKADDWGRKRLFLIGFAALPIRGILFAHAQGHVALIAVQIFDGVASGIYTALFFLVVADLTRGTGVFCTSIGLVAVAQGVGVSLTSLFAEPVAQYFGYGAAFYALSAIALAPLLLYSFFMPETRHFQPVPVPVSASRAGFDSLGPQRST